MAEYRLAMGEPILVHANGDRELQNKGLTLRQGVGAREADYTGSLKS